MQTISLTNVVKDARDQFTKKTTEPIKNRFTSKNENVAS